MPATVLWATGFRWNPFGGGGNFTDGRGSPPRGQTGNHNPFAASGNRMALSRMGLAPRSTLGIGMFCHRSGGSNPTWIELWEGGTSHLRVSCDASGFPTVTRNGVLLGTASIAVPGTGSAYSDGVHLEVRFVLHDTTGSVLMRVNGTAALTLTGIDTQNGGTGLVDAIGLSLPNDWRVGDYVLHDNADWLGDRAVVDVVQDAGGTYTDGVASSGTLLSCVDDAGAHDGDSSYVTLDDTALPKQVSFTNGDLPAAVASIDAVVPWVVVRSTDSLGTTGQILTRSGATDAAGATIGPPTAYDYHAAGALLTDPDTAAAWTVGGVNAAEVGWIRQT